MVKIIGCGKFSIFFLHPLIASVFYIIRSYVMKEMMKHKKPEKSNVEWKNNPLFMTLIMFMGESMVGFYEIYYCYAATRRKINGQLINNTTRRESKITVIVQEKKSLWIIIAMLIGIIINEAFCFYGLQQINLRHPDSSSLYTNIRIFKLVYDSLFCFLILKYRIYIHHYVAIGLLLIGITFITIPDLINQKQTELHVIGLFFLHSLLLSLSDCVEKWLMENNFIQGIRLLFLRGIFGSLLTLLIAVIFYSVGYDNIFPMFGLIFSSDDLMLCFLFIVYFLCCALYNCFYAMTNQFYSPTYMGVSDAFSTIVLMIVENITEKRFDINYLALFLIGYFLVIVGCIIYNEVIILYFCNLERDTRKEVEERSANEHEVELGINNLYRGIE